MSKDLNEILNEIKNNEIDFSDIVPDLKTAEEERDLYKNLTGLDVEIESISNRDGNVFAYRVNFPAAKSKTLSEENQPQ